MKWRQKSLKDSLNESALIYSFTKNTFPSFDHAILDRLALYFDQNWRRLTWLICNPLECTTIQYQFGFEILNSVVAIQFLEGVKKDGTAGISKGYLHSSRKDRRPSTSFKHV